MLIFLKYSPKYSPEGITSLMCQYIFIHHGTFIYIYMDDNKVLQKEKRW